MELTKKDRVFLINQYEILKRLDPDRSSHYEEIIEILKEGYEIYYSMVDRFIGDDMPRNEGKFVIDILDLYGSVEDYKRKNPNDEDVSRHRYSHFRGFDGTNEPMYMKFTNFLIETQGKYKEQLPYKEKMDGFSRHVGGVDKYKRMVEKWQEKGREDQPSKENILEILNA